VDFADHSIACDTADLTGDLTRAQSIIPEFFEHFDALVSPCNGFNHWIGPIWRLGRHCLVQNPTHRTDHSKAINAHSKPAELDDAAPNIVFNVLFTYKMVTRGHKSPEQERAFFPNQFL
jgi:hypothetical protein